MKIAICLSGHLRRFERTAGSLLNYVKANHECDIFIHTWDKMGYASAYKTDLIQDNTSKYLSRVEHYYKPKKIIVEDSMFIEHLKMQGDQYAPHLKNVPKHVGHMASMFYKIYTANELRKQYELETSTKYDWIIRSRTDLLFSEPVKLPDSSTENEIFMPQHLCGHAWLCDQFAIAKPDAMDLYSSFFFDMPAYFSAQKEYRPEVFMHHCMEGKKLKPVMWKANFTLIR